MSQVLKRLPLISLIIAIGLTLANPAFAVNYQEAIDACDRGSSQGCDSLGRILMFNVEQNNQRTAQVLDKACHTEVGTGCFYLGFMYEAGPGGFPVDLNKALHIYSKGCAIGDGASCNNLGGMYEYGHGTAENYEKAAQLYDKSCRLGEGWGCDHLGLMYDKGPDGMRNKKKALQFYDKACSMKIKTGCSHGEILRAQGVSAKQ